MRKALIVVLLLMVPLSVFLQTLRFDFVWDDEVNVAKNPRVSTPAISGFNEIWQRPYEGLYIPLTYTLWAALAPIARSSAASDSNDLNPAIYHLANIALHLLNGLLAFTLLRRIVPDDWAAATGALVFLIHPAQVEAVAWITGMKDLLSCCFSFLTLWQYLAYADSKRASKGRGTHGANDLESATAAGIWLKPWAHYGAATLFFIAAMLAKPAAVVLPIIGFLLDRFVLKRSLRGSAVPLGFWVLLSAPCVILTRLAQPENELGFVPSLWVRPFIAMDALAFYLYKLLLPFPLAPDYGRSPNAVMATGWIYWSWLVPVAIGLLLWHYRDKYPTVILAVGIFVAGMLAVSGIVPFRFQNSSTVADRYVYLSFAGVALGTAWLVDRFRSRIMISASALVLLFLAIISAVQVRYWRDDTTLFRHTLEINPQSWAAHYGLGRTLVREGNNDSAIQHFREAVRLQPEFTKAHFSLAGLLRRAGDVESSIREYREALRIAPRYADAHHGLARALEAQGDFDDAIVEYRHAIEAAPGRSDIFYDFGRMLAARGEPAGAADQFRSALQIDPGFAPARQALDAALAELRQSQTSRGG